MKRQEPPGLGMIGSAGFLLAGMIIVSSLFGIAWFHWSSLSADEWTFYARFVQKSLWQAVWSSWNGHRLLFPGLIQYANLTWFGGRLGHLAFINMLAIVCSAWLLVRWPARLVVHRSSRWILVVSAMAMLLWFGNRLAMQWGFGLTYTLGILGAVGASHSMTCSRDAVSGDTRWPWLAVAVASACLSCFSWGSGLVMWPVLFYMALVLRLSKTAVVAVGLCGAAAIVIYFLPGPKATGLVIFPYHLLDNLLPQRTALYQVQSFGLHTLALMLYKMLGVLGNAPTHLIVPFVSERPHWLTVFARAAGAIGLVLTLVLAYLGWRRGKTAQWLLHTSAIALFALGTACAISLTRWFGVIPLGHENYGLADRYCIFSALLWAALVCGFFPMVSPHFSQARQRFAMAAACLSVLLCLAPSQAAYFVRAGMQKNSVREASIGYVMGIVDKPKLFSSRVAVFYPGRVRPVAVFLRDRHLGIFSQGWTYWLGTSIKKPSRAAAVVNGGLGGVQTVDSSGWRIHGWVAKAYPHALIVGVDQKGRIRALAGLTRPLAVSHAMLYPPESTWLAALGFIDSKLPAIFGWGRGWFGYAKCSCKPDRLHFYVVGRDKQIIARIGRTAKPVQNKE